MNVTGFTDMEQITVVVYRSMEPGSNSAQLMVSVIPWNTQAFVD